ncbi:hypothetical protein CPJCM30710_00540 [Clostridium polyendosporum]|uniref:Nucleotidyltransferase family protein n=1 Tax=Clostridium polyendosporum TaxID=69208 RepID=A0A919RXK3_9CLOT|nr:nucleotidyltransferase family protein [Clostridium polyendosporum]GIM27388.1 hypothetical protein CPJCM30710_00540 [Clostridium polyendosporum]
MNSTQKTLVTLLSAAIRGKDIDKLDIHDINWREVYEEAKAHEVYALIYPLFKKMSKTCNIDSILLTEWSKDTIINSIVQTQHINQMKNVFKAFEEDGVPVIALKGLILRDLYPRPEFRTMSDADILVKEEFVEAAETVLLQLGYKKDSSIAYECCFIHENNLSIDLHWSLSNHEHLRNVAPFEDTVWNNLRELDFHGVKVQALSLEYELMHLFIHIASHMIKSGFGVRQLCDIVVFIESERTAIDWDLLFDLSESCRLNKLISVILTLCDTLLDLNVPATYKTNYFDSAEYIKILTNEVFESGVYGKRDETRVTSTRILSHSLQSNDDFNKFKLIFRYVFPSSDKLDKRYSYASKYTFLIVFAWLHRIFYELFLNTFKRLKELFKLSSTASLVKDRFDLIDWLQL